MKIPFTLSPRLYCFLAGFVAIMFAGIVAGCFALALQGQPIPEFATKQLFALGGILGALLTGPHPLADSTPASGSPSDVSSAEVSGADATGADANTPSQ